MLCFFYQIGLEFSYIFLHPLAELFSCFSKAAREAQSCVLNRIEDTCGFSTKKTS
jgi:hypothetical protein